ncbi:hypothetical protein B0A52_00737 [Exophiala mesophila]|uniref:Carboxylic ester hydrolase n=1 Tax=Exophiala mesophila TaxID=212818 RepID=A0A438NI32_EXOME|nr:hypothetical protein B0A52_00737 [Exophiala mesophila]
MKLPLVFASLTALVAAVDPEVGLGYATYRGVPLSNAITQWLGIRYAAAPLGPLRFAAPQDPPPVDQVQPADQHGPICLATGAAPNHPSTSEDCLFLDVYAPSDATNDSKLPVYFFIQGGGFNSLANPNYNGSGLITAADHQIVVVTVNYRVGPYGFIASKEIVDSPSATLNNGLRDQRKALEWVQKHISRFGGDPNHVVLGGDSAGAASIAIHLSANGGQDKGLFHGAAAESVSFGPVLTVEQSQYQYDNLVERLGCHSTTSTSSTTLACLRSKTSAEMQAQNHNIPYPGLARPPLFMWNPVVDGELIQEYTYSAFEDGRFIQVPVIFGDDTNGGTVFVPRGTSNWDESSTFLQAQLPFLHHKHLERIAELYPNRGPQFPNSGPWWRQASNAYGDIRYMCPNLFISSMFVRHAAGVGMWNYRFNVQDPGLVAAGLGAPHTMEISAIWGPENVRGGTPASFWPNHSNAWVVPWIQAYWTSFIRTLDPNVYRLEDSPEWRPFVDQTEDPEATSETAKRRLLFESRETTGMETVDQDLASRCDYFKSIGAKIQQ